MKVIVMDKFPPPSFSISKMYSHFNKYLHNFVLNNSRLRCLIARKSFNLTEKEILGSSRIAHLSNSSKSGFFITMVLNIEDKSF